MCTVVVEPEPAWGRDVDHEEAHKARAAAVAAGQPSYTVRSSSGRAGKTFWVCTAPAPACMPRCVQPVQGCRHGARPSGAAYKAGKRLGRDVHFTGDFVDNDWEWAVDSIKMPDESKQEDTGWQPGPADRAKPAFKGRTPGPADPTLSAASTEREIMARLLTDQIVGMIADFGRQHAQHYRSAVLQVESAKELAALSDTIEAAMDWEFNNLNGDSVRLWIAAKLRVACLSEAVNEDVLWDSTSSLYDELLDSKMPFSAYQWFNRHMSFSHYEADDETAEKDRFRKRRMVLDVINALLPLTYNPHQDVGVDEKVSLESICIVTLHAHMVLCYPSCEPLPPSPSSTLTSTHPLPI